MEGRIQEPDMASLLNLLEAIKQITPAERAQLLGELARAVTNDLGDKKAGTMLQDPQGNAVGLFLPVGEAAPKPPPMSPAERAELQTRLDNRHEAVPYEEFVNLLQPADQPATAQSK
jgi:hypothetical protein